MLATRRVLPSAPVPTATVTMVVPEVSGEADLQPTGDGFRITQVTGVPAVVMPDRNPDPPTDTLAEVEVDTSQHPVGAALHETAATPVRPPSPQPDSPPARASSPLPDLSAARVPPLPDLTPVLQQEPLLPASIRETPESPTNETNETLDLHLDATDESDNNDVMAGMYFE